MISSMKKLFFLALFVNLLAAITCRNYVGKQGHRSGKVLAGDSQDHNNTGSDYPNAASCQDSCFRSGYYDLALIVEASSFSGKGNWIQTMKPFIKSVANKFKISNDGVHMAVVLFASDSEELVSFADPESTDKKALLAKIDDLSEKDVGNFHNILYCDALLFAIETMLFEEGTREDAGKAAVLFSYGYDNETNAGLIPDVVESYHEQGVRLVVVGMEMNGNPNMYALAGCANNDSACPSAIVVQYEYLFKAGREIKVMLERKREA